MLEIEVHCDHCGRAKTLTMPFRATRGRRQAIALGLDHFNMKGFRVRPDGSHACRRCELARMADLKFVAGAAAILPALGVLVVSLTKGILGALRIGAEFVLWATGEVED